MLNVSIILQSFSDLDPDESLLRAIDTIRQLEMEVGRLERAVEEQKQRYEHTLSMQEARYEAEIKRHSEEERRLMDKLNAAHSAFKRKRV